MIRFKRYFWAAVRFLGPVAGAVQGTLSKPEIVRALAKATVVGTATRTSMTAVMRDQETLTEVVVPLAAAVFTGVMDALGSLGHGDPKPEPAPAPDEVPPFPLPTNPESQP